MDEFARLRRSIYTGRKTTDWRADTEGLLSLARALLDSSMSDHAIRELASAALLRSSRANDHSQDAKLTDAAERPATLSTTYAERYHRDALLAASGWRRGEHPACKPLDPRGPSHPQVPHDVSVVQCMFHGDPLLAGRGNSGGIATLLMDLGALMGPIAGGVVTLVLHNTVSRAGAPAQVEPVAPGHTIVRVPVELEEESVYGFMVDRDAIESSIHEALDRHGLDPDIIHVRYLDDASLAAAHVARSRGIRLVATLTPDPHRTVCDASGSIRVFSPDEGLQVFNKILIGDDLVAMADGILAIGPQSAVRQLIPYYPQLEDTRGRLLEGIDEGVRIRPELPPVDVADLLTGGSALRALDSELLSRPALVTVGRLAPVKQQTALVKAWSLRAFRTHNLVVIGGDHERPTPDEQKVLDQISTILRETPELEGRICLLPAQPNPVIRAIHEYFAGEVDPGGITAYVCPSVKEEFGLSILEAMAAGMMVCAPVRGGARSYIRHAVNGFLVDTSDHDGLASELDGTILQAALDPDRSRAIRANARETVLSNYSMEAISAKFVQFYGRVLNA